MTPHPPPPSSDADLTILDTLVTHCRGAHALMAGVTLGLFDALHVGPSDAGELARRMDADVRSTRVLLDALCAMKLVEKSDDTYRNAPTAERYLVTTSPQCLAHNFQFQQILAPAWAMLPAIVRSGTPVADLPALLSEDPEFVDAYIHGMADISVEPARELASKLDLTGVCDVLDVGGGAGVYAEAIVAQEPGARVTLVDVPATLRIAGKRLSASPYAERIELVDSDYFDADFGTARRDLVLFSHVLHDESEAGCRRLLGKAFDALRPGGRVVIHDFMPDERGDHPLFHALFSVHLLVYTAAGRAYCAHEYDSWLAGLGFVEIQRIAICEERTTSTTAIVARRP